MLNGLNNCQVRISKSSYIQLSVSLSISVSDFYSNSGTTTFISNICAFLGIDTGRLKIVSVRTGSLSVTLYIIPLIISTTNSTNTTTSPSVVQTTLDNLSNILSQGLTNQTLDVGFPILTFNVSNTVFNTDGTVYQVPNNPGDSGMTDGGNKIPNNWSSPSESSSSKTLIIILATVIPAVIICLVLVTLALIRKRSQIHSDPQLFSM